MAGDHPQEKQLASPAETRSSPLRAWAWLCERLGLADPGARALKAAEQQALQAETRLREAINALPEGLVFLDQEGRYLLWNERYAEIYHRSADLFREGVKLADTLAIGVARGDYPEAVGREQEWLAERLSLLDHPGKRHEQLLADGRWVMIEERRTSDGGTIGLRVDITEMKQQAEALSLAVDRAEAASRAKSNFLANMSHEIRTPLNGVLGLAEALGRSELDVRQREMVETIVASAATLDGILADLLDFSRLEAGRLSINETPFDLAELIERNAAPFAAAAAAKGLRFVVEADDAKGAVVRGDAVRLSQILTNLLSNAIKFTSDGEVRMTVAATPRGGGYAFSVTDTGIGFEPQEAERLFNRFEQGDDSITRRFGGTGLGLSICRQLAELMGGRISADARPGCGATFSLFLPLPTVAQPAAETPTLAEGPEQALRVLIADDNATNRRVAELILQAVGATTTCVEDGAAAVAAVQQDDFDLVLMDLQMPVMDGLAATRAIRAREMATGAPRLPIVVLSANVMHEHVAASAAAGADDHVGKPVRAEVLIRAILNATAAEHSSIAV